MTVATVADYMTRAPHTVDVELPLLDADAVMRGARVRHLVVTRGGRLCGLLSQRDLQLALGLPGVAPSDVTVEDAMIRLPYCVAPEARLTEVAATMASHKWGAALVTVGERVVGIFTTTDALQALARSTTPPPRARRRAVSAAKPARASRARRSDRRDRG